MRIGSRSNRRGFTLVETVVTVGIVAALAAVVYPSVVKQFDSADPTKAAEDLNAISTGLAAFGINVRPQFPSDIEDLVNRPAAAGDSTLAGALYSGAEQGAWLGPYLQLSVLTTALQTDTVATTGFSGRIMNRIHPFDIGAAPNGGDTLALGVAGADFGAVRIVALSGSAFNAINSVIDGPTETTAATRRERGRFRCPFTGPAPADLAACPNAYYLAVPVR